MNGETLQDWGEFRLINEIVLPILSSTSLSAPLGSDCAYVPIPKNSDSLVVTCDAGPKPLAWDLDYKSFWSWGWYSVIINASDLAAAGAKPLAFTSSVEAPASMPVQDFRDFFEGISNACQELDIPNAGGNIRAAPRFECHGTAIGTIQGGNLLTRSNCKPGDSIVVIGECGRFIAAYLKAKEEGIDSLPEEDWKRIVRPWPRLREMSILQKSDFINASTDNSDGILGALWNIAERSNCAIEVDMNDEFLPAPVCSAADMIKTDPWNLMFFWGDWQVVIAVAKDALVQFKTIAAKEEIQYSVIGRATEESSALYGNHAGKRKRLNLLRNENFISLSFNSNLQDHLKSMLYAPLFV